MAFKRKKGVSKRYAAKRRPMTKRKFRRMPRGSYKTKGRGKRSLVTVKSRSLSNTVWLGNPVGNDYICNYIMPFIGATDVLDNYSYLTNPATSCNLGVFSTINLSKFKNVFEMMYVSSMWLKYTPAITEGAVGTVLNGLGLSGGGVAGTITVLPTNDMAKDRLEYTLTANGLLSLKSNVRSTTFSMYKPCFIRWVPKIKVDIADGGSVNLTRYLPYKVQLDSDDWLSSGNNGVIALAQVPVEAGVQYSSVNPFAGGNWPAEGTTATVGKIEMGATCHFYKLKI